MERIDLERVTHVTLIHPEKVIGFEKLPVGTLLPITRVANDGDVWVDTSGRAEWDDDTQDPVIFFDEIWRGYAQMVYQPEQPDVVEVAKQFADTMNARAPKTYTLAAYLDTGAVFEWSVGSEAQAREHAHAVINDGYRSSSPDELTYYPAHRILKVTVSGDISSNYHDRVRGT